MASIENTKPELLGVLPQEEYDRFTRSPKNQHIPKDLLKLFSDIPVDASGDVFGQIYEYFLANFALSEGQGGGEFFTPRSVVKLMTEIIEPHGGKVFDPACGSGGMFVQSADFILQHQADKAADLDVFVCGTEKTLETVKLAKMNLAVNNLRGDIKQANSYYEDPFNAFGAFDYVMANPPFNVDDVTLDAVERDRRFNTYGVPRNKTKAKATAGKDGKERAVETVPNGNYGNPMTSSVTACESFAKDAAVRRLFGLAPDAISRTGCARKSEIPLALGEGALQAAREPLDGPPLQVVDLM